MKQLGDGERSLGIGEFEQLKKMARVHPRLDQALKLRVAIVASADAEHQRELSSKVDSALRRLREQITLKKRIDEALATIDRDRLAREVAGAQAQAQQADSEDGVHSLAAQLALQLEQVDRLTERHKELDDASDRIVLLLGNLNLALLEAQSSRATAESDKVRSVLANLEDAGDTMRRTSEAEAEVDRLLRASQANALKA